MLSSPFCTVQVTFCVHSKAFDWLAAWENAWISKYVCQPREEGNKHLFGKFIIMLNQYFQAFFLPQYHLNGFCHITDFIHQGFPNFIPPDYRGTWVYPPGCSGAKASKEERTTTLLSVPRAPVTSDHC